MEKYSIFTLEDEENIRRLLQYNLETAGFHVECFGTGRELFLRLEQQKPDLLLLDIMLPDMDGMLVLRILKEQENTRNIPIILLSARSSELDKVLGLELGSEDYVTKPFSIRELLARIHVVLRRESRIKIQEDTQGIPLCFRDLVMDPSRHILTRNGKEIRLTLKQFQLLHLFLQNPHMLFTREMLLEKVWGYDYYGGTRTVDVHIRLLRKCLDDSGKECQYIETVRGIGYRLKC